LTDRRIQDVQKLMIKAGTGRRWRRVVKFTNTTNSQSPPAATSPLDVRQS
jgi:hypothetical protein